MTPPPAMVALIRVSNSLLPDERLVDVGDDAAPGDGGLDQSVQLLVSSDGELKMSGSDSLHFQIFGSVASQLEDLSSKIFQDSRAVDSSSGSHPSAGKASALEMSVNPSNRELESSPGRPRDCLLFGFPGVLSSFASSHGSVLYLELYSGAWC